MLTKVKGPTDLFEDVYPPVDIVDTSTKEWADETAEKYVAVPLNDPITIKDLCETIPLSRWINSVPIPMTLMDDAWKKAHPYPTPIDYYLLYEDKHYKDLSDVKRSASNVEFPKERDWIDIGSVNIATFGTQRIQFQNREATPKLFKRAVNFDHTLTSIQTAKLDSTDFPQLKDACFVTNGAGTLCSAYLRGERRIAATIVNVTSEEELENLFFEVDGSKVKISAFEKYKTKLAMGDPFARLQDRVMDDAGVTPLKNHPDDLWYTDLSPLAKGLKGKFDNDESSSISGDSRKQVQDTNLFVTRKARNIVDTYELMMSVWADDGSKQIHSSLFGALLAFKATGNGMVTVKKLETMLKDFKEEKIEMPLSSLDPAKYGFIDFSTQFAASSSLDLTRVQTTTTWGVCALARVWNHYYRDNQFQVEFLIDLQNRTKFNKYDPSKDYSKL